MGEKEEREKQKMSKQKEIIYLENPEEKLDELHTLFQFLYEGFMAVAMDYGYHIENVFGKSKDGKHQIYELRNNMHYKIRTARLHFRMLLGLQKSIEKNLTEMLVEDPGFFYRFPMGNPHLERASDEMMGIYDSIVFHLSSSFDYLAMLIQFCFGKQQQKHLMWNGLSQSCFQANGEFSSKHFAQSVKQVNNSFVSKFNDYRADLIHRKKSSSYANVSWEMYSHNVKTKFVCSEKLKSELKKVLDREKNYCITYIVYLLIRETILNICYVLEGVNDEFRKNYNPHAPVMEKGGMQILDMNPETGWPESPALASWKKFLEYKNHLKS